MTKQAAQQPTFRGSILDADPPAYGVNIAGRMTGKIEACSNGFHACPDPFDVWSYYPVVDDLGRLTRYAEVEQSGDTDRADNKIASAHIAIKAEMRLPEFIKKAVERVIDLTRGKGDDPSGDSARIGSSGGSARIGSSGGSARIGSSGDSARIGSSGDSARIGSSGGSARIGSSGYSARIGSSGDSARIGSSGYSAQIGSSGDYAQIGSSGGSARIGSSGYSARISATGQNAVVASAGNGAIVSGVVGTWISLAEFDDNGKCIGFATGCIGKDGLKADTPYRAMGGKLVEVA